MRIATPCDRHWEELTGGGEQVRFCEQCEKRVFNLSAMTAAEGEALLKKKRAGLCVFYEQSADGAPVSVEQRRPPVQQIPQVAIAAAALIVLSAACTTNEERVESAPVVAEARVVARDEDESRNQSTEVPPSPPEPAQLSETERRSHRYMAGGIGPPPSPSTVSLPRSR